MRMFFSAFLMVVLCGAEALLCAQAPAAAPPATSDEAGTASAILRPALDTLQQTLDMLQPNRWKTSGAVRDATEANVSSIRRDVETTLPPLLAAADQAPDSVTSVLPAFRNVEALYDVLLRVTEIGRLSAPSQQSAALEEAMTSLEGGRRALGDRIQTAASAQDQRVRDLQAAAHAAVATPAPVAVPVCPAPAPVKKRKPHAKPAPKPAAPTPGPQADPTAPH